MSLQMPLPVIFGPVLPPERPDYRCASCMGHGYMTLYIQEEVEVNLGAKTIWDYVPAGVVPCPQCSADRQSITFNAGWLFEIMHSTDYIETLEPVEQAFIQDSIRACLNRTSLTFDGTPELAEYLHEIVRDSTEDVW